MFQILVFWCCRCCSGTFVAFASGIKLLPICAAGLAGVEDGVEEPECTTWLLLGAQSSDFCCFWVSVMNNMKPNFFLCLLNLNKKTAIFWELLFDSGSRDER